MLEQEERSTSKNLTYEPHTRIGLMSQAFMLASERHFYAIEEIESDSYGRRVRAIYHPSTSSELKVDSEFKKKHSFRIHAYRGLRYI